MPAKANIRDRLLRPEGAGWRVARRGWYVCAAISMAVVLLAVPGYLVRRPMGSLSDHLAYEPTPLMVALNSVSLIVSFAAALVSLALAALLYRKRPRDSMALYLAYYLLVHGVLLAGPIEMLEYRWPGMAAINSFVLLPTLFVPLSMGLLALFPDGRFVPGWTRWAVVASLGLGPVAYPLAEAGLSRGDDPVVSALMWVAYGLTAALGAALVYGQMIRYRRHASAVQQQQTKWVLYGFAVMFCLMAASHVPWQIALTLPPETAMPWWVPPTEMVWTSSVAILPIALTVAVTRYRLYDLDLLVNRTLVYGSLSAAVVLLYVAVVSVSGLALQSDSQLAASLLATGLVVFLLRPLYRQIQMGADRLIAPASGPERHRETRVMAGEVSNSERVGDSRGRQSAPDAPVQAASSGVGRLAWPLAVTAAAITLAAFGTGAFLAVSSGDGQALLSHQLLTPFIAVAYAALGGLVASRHPRNPIGWIFTAVGWLSAASITLAVYHTYGHLIPGIPILPEPNLNLWIPGTFLPTVFVFFLFPDGRLPSRRWRLVFWPAVLGLGITWGALALHPGPVPAWDVAAGNPHGAPALAGALDVLLALGQPLLAVGTAGSVAAFVLRFWRARGVERQQMKWLGYAVGLMLVSFLFGSSVWSLMPDNELASELSIMTTSLSILAIAVATGVAILRYRLYDIDVVINRTLVYGSLTVSVVAIYVLVVGGVGALLQTEGSLLISLGATGLIAVLFHPMRNRLQHAVDRFFYGQRDDPLGTLSQLARRLEAAIDPEVVLPTLVETIAQTLKLPYVAISLRTGDGFKVAARVGNEVADVLRFPLIYQGETVGLLVAGQRGPGEAFSGGDKRLLAQIARQAGPAVRAVQLTAALQRSRQQLVTAREEERRRLRRDLHDGLGATLAALHLEAGGLRRAIRSDPERAEALVNEFRADIRATIGEIRRLVYDLRPPTLDQLGLVAAVRAQAAACGRQERPENGAVRIRVEAPAELPPLPAAVEVAAYRIAQEALTNVVHHARARRCRVRLEMTTAALKLEVVDDGIGLAGSEPDEGGVGLLSMRERAAELGGTCVIEEAPGGGTRVAAILPLPPR